MAHDISNRSKKIQFSVKGSIFAYAGKKPKIEIDKAFVGKMDLNDFLKTDTSSGATLPPNKARWDRNAYNVTFMRKMDAMDKVMVNAVAEAPHHNRADHGQTVAPDPGQPTGEQPASNRPAGREISRPPS